MKEHIGTFVQRKTVIAQLALHQSRREQSISTLSVLTGGAVTTKSAWTDWIRQDDRQTTVCTYRSIFSLFEAWMDVIFQQYDLRSLILEQLAQLTDKSSEQLSIWLSYTGDYQRAQFWHQYVHSPQILWLKALLTSMDGGSVGELSEGLRKEGILLRDDDLDAITQGFTHVCKLLPQCSVPGVLVRLSQGRVRLSGSYKCLATMVQLAEAVPFIPFGILLSPEQMNEIMLQMSESRVKSALRGGLIESSTPEAGEFQKWLGNRGLEPSADLQSFIRVAQTDGVTEEILDTVASIQKLSGSAALTEEKDENFRSLPERLLFQYLEARPATAGKFQVNAKLAIRFGNRDMEVDFLAADSQVVVELDGYHHFQALDNYRRDRRKDIALQQNGFWVLRFLSEDVVANLEEILATIEQALLLRLA